jgi:hypothetical protein
MRPVVVPASMLRPTDCVSALGMATANSFPVCHTRPRKVHTGLLSMLVANELPEMLVEQLLGSACGVAMLKSIVSAPQGALRRSMLYEGLVRRIRTSLMK